MAEIVPTVGRIVLYRLSQVDVDAINKQRGSAYCGNDVEVGMIYPAIVVAVWGATPTSAINLQVMLDGVDGYWATSRTVGDADGHYHWMDYQKKVADGKIPPVLHAGPAS